MKKVSSAFYQTHFSIFSENIFSNILYLLFPKIFIGRILVVPKTFLCLLCLLFQKRFRSPFVRLFPENSLTSFDKRGDGEQKNPREGFQLQGGFTALSFHFYRGGQSPYIFFQSGFSRTLRFESLFLRGEGAVFIICSLL